MNQEDIKKKFEQLQSRAQKINESAIKLNTQIESSQENLKKAKEVLEKKYGTSDLAKLEALANEWYQADLAKTSKLESDVKALEDEVAEKQSLVKQIQNY